MHVQSSTFAIGPTTLLGVQIGKEIRRRRLAAGLTIEALAERSGVVPHHISNLERGKIPDPHVSTIIALAKGLGRVAPGELIGTIKDLSPRALEAARLFESVPGEVQEGVLQVLRATTRRRR
ncbi:MAG: helix-turn-helix transcriptional regulator [Phycisphaerales bacterium]|nr:helix-turn-helix transcriptional regulator [Phycisphaerales bacterium]